MGIGDTAEPFAGRRFKGEGGGHDDLEYQLHRPSPPQSGEIRSQSVSQSKAGPHDITPTGSDITDQRPSHPMDLRRSSSGSMKGVAQGGMRGVLRAAVSHPA
jgi:hypothetical protein